MAKICENCNIRKEKAKEASNLSIIAYLCEYIRNWRLQHGGKPLVEKGVLIDVGKMSFTVWCPKLGEERVIHKREVFAAKELKIEKSGLRVLWKNADIEEKVPLFSVVYIQIEPNRKPPIDLDFILVPKSFAS